MKESPQESVQLLLHGKELAADFPVQLMSTHVFLFKTHYTLAAQCPKSPPNLSRPLFPNWTSPFGYYRNVCVCIFMCSTSPPSTTAPKARGVLSAVSIATDCNGVQNTSGVQWMKRGVGGESRFVPLFSQASCASQSLLIPHLQAQYLLF